MGGGKMQLFQRTASLYANYWLVFLIFIPLACFIKPDRYPENISSFILNFIGWKCSYNGEWWFFFPYILLVLTSPYILRLLHKPGAKGSFATSIALFGMFALCNTGEKHSSVIQMPGTIYHRAFHVCQRSLICTIRYIAAFPEWFFTIFEQACQHGVRKRHSFPIHASHKFRFQCHIKSGLCPAFHLVLSMYASASAHT